MVSCYDGTAAAGNVSGLIPPMGYDQSYGTATPVVPFAWGAPAFSLQNTQLPVFVEVSSGAVASVGETYALAASAALLPSPGGAPVDWSLLAVMSVTWAGDAPQAALLDVRLRGGPRLGFVSYGGTTNVTAPPGGGGGGWAFSNGQQFYFSYAVMQERVLTGFVRAAARDYASVGSATLANGPDCGASPGAQGSPNPCLGPSGPSGARTRAVYYVQLPRA